MSVKSFIALGPGSKGVEHSTHNPKIWGLNPATGTGRQKRKKCVLFESVDKNQNYKSIPKKFYIKIFVYVRSKKIQIVQKMNNRMFL